MAIDDQTLIARLTETVAWCNSLEQIGDFRSEQLRPRVLHNGADDAVCEVGRCRANWYRQQKFETPIEMPDLKGGELMVYFPEENLSDGYADLVSKGFFDVENTPPYDTWVAFFDDGPHVVNQGLRTYLVCFVPQRFIELAEAGIDGNPEECILWLRQSNTRFKERYNSSPRPRGSLLTSIKQLFSGET
jgi:hypothetical protein